MYELDGYVYPGDPQPILKVIYAETMPDFHVLAQFNDGEIRDYDMSQTFSAPAFSLLNNADAFKEMYLFHGVPTWTVKGNEIDIAPEAIYNGGIPLEMWPATDRKEA